MLELGSTGLITTDPAEGGKKKNCTLRMPTYGGTTVVDRDGSDGTYSHARLRDVW